MPSVYFSQNGLPAAVHVPYSFLTARAFPQVGLTWDYPFVHRGSDFTYLVQPTVATFVGPNGGNRWILPNEDSLGYEFRDSTCSAPTACKATICWIPDSASITA